MTSVSPTLQPMSYLSCFFTPQICRSWLNIAEVQELQGLEYNDVSKSYLTAYETAKKAKQRKLQVRLSKIHTVQSPLYSRV